MTTTLRSCPQGNRAETIARMAEHKRQDQIVQGGYWSPTWDDPVEDTVVWRGCAIGCLVHGDSHEDAAALLGVPVEIAHAIDRIFECLPSDDAIDFPGRVLEALADDVDTTHVWARLAPMMGDDGVSASTAIGPRGLMRRPDGAQRAADALIQILSECPPIVGGGTDE